MLPSRKIEGGDRRVETHEFDRSRGAEHDSSGDGSLRTGVRGVVHEEELQAICEALEVDVDESGQPSATRMRQLIRAQVGVAESLETADDSTFRKADLQAISDAVGASSES